MKRLNRFFKKFDRRDGLATALLSLSLATCALGNPSGPTVRHGQVQITAGTQAQIQQLTDRAIVDWQSFSIGSHESVRFLQPSDLSVILNRVTGGDPSSILGRMDANGNVFLINPNGILFGPNSVVNVGGLVASSLQIADEDFLSGNYSFNADSGQDLGAVVNQGTIKITDGGYAVLTGPSVINEGTIVAKAGNVTLAAGERATLNLDGRDLVHFALNQSGGSNGTVLLAPGMMSDTIAQTLGVQRYQMADRIVREADGSVRMLNSSGTLVQAGTVSSDGTETGSDGGSVLIESTDFTLLTGASVTSSNGTGQGNGGEVVVLSNMESGTTSVENGARLSAASPAADGGFIETSAAVVGMAGPVDASGAVNPGTYLLDPTFNVTRIVDELYTGGGSFVTDLVLETTLNLNMDAIVESSAGIVSDVTATSAAEGGSDTGIQATGIGNLRFDTANLGGNDIDLGVDQFDLGGSFELRAPSAGTVDLNSATIDIDGSFNIMAGSVDLGSAQITADQGANINSENDLIGTGFSIDTRQDPNIFTDGGDIFMNASNVDFDLATIRFAQPFSTGGLTITGGPFEITNSMILSESEPVAGFRDQYKASVTIADTSFSNDVTILNSTITGTAVLIQGNTINLQSTDIDTTVRDSGAVIPFPSSITINANGFLNGPTGSNALHSKRIYLTSSDESVSANIDTSSDGDDPSAPYTSVATRLTVEAAGGNITITDIAASNALGIDLSRPNGRGSGQPADTDAIIAGGNITISSQGKIGFGTGDGVTRDQGWEGTPGLAEHPIVRTTGVSGNVSISAVGPLLDQNGVRGTEATPTTGSNEIIAGGTVTLNSGSSVGSMDDPFFTGVFEVTANHLIVNADGVTTPVNVGGPGFETVDITIDGGEVKVTDQGAGAALEINPNGAGPDILQIETGFSANNVRVSSSEDLAVFAGSDFAGERLILTTTNGGRILNEDPGNTGQPNLIMSNTNPGGGSLVLGSSGDIGTAQDPFRVQGPNVFLANTTANIFLDLDPFSAGPISIQGVDSVVFSQPLTSPTITGANLSSVNDLVVESSDSLNIQSLINSTGGVAFDSTGTVTLSNDVTADTALIFKATDLINADGRIHGGVVGLEIGQDVGSAADPLDVDMTGLVLGSNPARSYFIRDNGNQDASLLNSVTVGGVTVAGNQTSTLQVEKNQGSLTVDSSVSSADRLSLQVGGNIVQGASGQLNAPAIVLKSDGSIGDIDSDLQLDAQTLALAGQNAYVRDVGSDLELVSDAAVAPSVGAQNELRVRVDEGDLTVSTDLNGGDIALIAGTTLDISAQTAAQDIIINGNITAGGNMVLIAAGDIVGVSGTLSANAIGLGAGGNIGSAVNPLNLSANEFVSNKTNPNVTFVEPPSQVDSVSSVGATVNGQVLEEVVTPENGVVVEVVLYPEEEEITGPEFAQDNVDLVEDFLRTLDEDSILDELTDPTGVILEWYDDGEFLRHKRR